MKADKVTIVYGSTTLGPGSPDIMLKYSTLEWLVFHKLAEDTKEAFHNGSEEEKKAAKTEFQSTLQASTANIRAMIDFINSSFNVFYTSAGNVVISALERQYTEDYRLKGIEKITDKCVITAIAHNSVSIEKV
jgi:hypothetical protein